MQILTKTQRSKSLFASYFVACLDNFGLGLVFILFAPLILKPEYGMLSADVSQHMRTIYLGILFAAFPFALFFGAPLFGDFADFYGRKRAFYWTILGTTIGYALSALAILWKSYLFLLISRLITGFFAGNQSICLAAIADLSLTEKERSKNFGILAFVWGISWPIAMLVGGYLSDPKLSSYFNPTLPFWITVILSFFEFAFVFFFFYETHVKGVKKSFDLSKGIHEILQAFKLPHVRRFFTVIFLWTCGWGASVQWYAAFGLSKFHVSQELMSWGLIVQGIFWSLGGLVVNPLLLKRFSSKEIAMIGLADSILFIFAASFAQTFALFSILYWFGALGAAIAFSNIMNLISLTAPEQIQGRTMGISQSMMSVAWIIVPLLGAGLSAISLNLLYPTFGLILLVGLLLLFFRSKTERTS